MAGDDDGRPDGGLRRLALHTRTRVRQGFRRARWAFAPTIVAAAAAAVAYVVSSQLLGHEMPIFAPTAAFLCLGFTSDRQLRRVAELGVGCTLGVGLGELFAALFGVGAIQIFFVLVLGTLAARIVDRGDLLTYQAGIQSIVVIAMPTGAMTDGAFGRWTDALVGAAIAFFVAALLPDNAIRRPRRRAQAAVTELSDMLQMLSEALRRGDPERARDALTVGRDAQQVLDNWEKTVRNARQVITVNPTMRADRTEVGRLARASVLADRAVRNARVVARKAESVVEAGPRPDLALSLDALASGLRLLALDLGRGDVPDLSQGRLAASAGTLDPDDYAVDGWPTQTLVSVLRSLVVDVLQIAGMSAADARGQLPDADGVPSAGSAGGAGPALGERAPSGASAEGAPSGASDVGTTSGASDVGTTRGAAAGAAGLARGAHGAAEPGGEASGDAGVGAGVGAGSADGQGDDVEEDIEDGDDEVDLGDHDLDDHHVVDHDLDEHGLDDHHVVDHAHDLVAHDLVDHERGEHDLGEYVNDEESGPEGRDGAGEPPSR